jgi:hypothetical protein
MRGVMSGKCRSRGISRSTRVEIRGALIADLQARAIVSALRRRTIFYIGRKLSRCGDDYSRIARIGIVRERKIRELKNINFARGVGLDT